MAGQGTKPRALIIERDPDLAGLLEVVLREEGFVAESQIVGAAGIAPLCSQRPDLIIVDLLNKRPDEDSPLLDALRVDPLGRRVPVLALAAQDTVAEAAYANYNVAATLAKPFDIEDFVAKVNEALQRPPLHAGIAAEPHPEGILAEAEAILSRYSRTVVFRWIRRLQKTEPWSAKRDLRLPDLLDHIPVLVEAIGLALQYGAVAEVFEKHPEVTRRAREHAWLRHNQGIDLRALILEYSLLREEVWRALSEHLDHALQPADVATLSALINGTVDRIVQAAMPTWGTPPDEGQG